MKRFFRRFLRVIGLLTFGGFLFVAVCNIWVIQATKRHVHHAGGEIGNLPEIAMVLGTSKSRKDGSPNPFFDDRMQVASDLYLNGSIKHILVSGDNRSPYYNEPRDMRKSLIKLNVPDSAITLDFAGLRTLDSVIRCKEIFGQDSILIVTQPFHSYRALFISQFYVMSAKAVVTDDLPFTYRYKVEVREIFARTKAVIDLYILKKTPRHLGEVEKINLG